MLLVTSTSAEELVAALQFRRFLKVNPSNFRIKDCPQLARSEVNILSTIQALTQNDQIKFGLQTRVEMLHGLDDQVQCRQHWCIQLDSARV